MKSKVISYKAGALGAAICLVAAASGCADDNGGAGNYPSEPVNLNAPAEPGSGWDTTARAMDQVFEEEDLVEVPVPVANQPGGIGCSWLTEMVNNHAGGTNQIAVTSMAIQTVTEQGLCDYGLDDVTMIATLYTEPFMVVAPTDSEIGGVDDLVSALEDDPSQVPIAAAGDDQLPFALFAEEVGIDPGELNFVTYDGGGEQTTALLSGDVTIAIAGLSEFRSILESGDVDALMTFNEEPLDAPFDSVPTSVDSGYDVTLSNWRGVYGPPEMPQDAVAYWEDTLADMVEAEGWQQTVENNQWTELFLTGDELNTYVDEAQEDVADGVSLTDLAF